MGNIRVTQRTLVDRVLTNINTQSATLQRLQEELSTGYSVNRPSDDPLAARRGVRARTDVAVNDQYRANITAVSPFLTESETAIMSTQTAMQRTSELVLQGKSDTNSPLQRSQIATEINQVLETVLAYSNQYSADRYAFGGTRTGQKPFQETRNANNEINAVTYVGNDEHFQIELGAGVRANANETGSDVFTNASGTDIFAMLIEIRDNMRNGNTNGLDTNLGQIKKAQEQLLTATARVGALQSRIERVTANLEDQDTQLKQTLSQNIDADYAEVMVNLNAQANAFQASLNAAARVIQPSLLDYVR